MPPVRPGEVARRRPEPDQPGHENPAPLTTSGNSPPVLTPENAEDLQRQIGNQAVSRLPTTATPSAAEHAEQAGQTEPTEQAAQGEQAEQTDQTEQTEQAEPEEERAGLTESEIDVMLGRTEAFGPAVPTFEVITATTAAQLSEGELEQEVGRLWERQRLSFTDAARQAAETDSSRNFGPAIPTQSASFEPDQSYAKRWMLGFYAHDYERKGGDIPSVKKLLRRGSPFQQSAQADFDQVFPVENPTGAQISTEINQSARHLRRGLESREIGELVVFFSGHGGGGSISGVDDKKVAPSELSALAELAQDFGIHTVYILDTCRAGSLASLAQLAAQDDIDESIAEGGLSDATMSSRSETLRTLATESLAAKEAATAMLDWHRWYRRQRRQRQPAEAIAEAEQQRVAAVNLFGEHISAIYALLHRVEDEMIPHRADLIRRSGTLMLGSVYALDPRRTRSFLTEMAPFFDTMNDSINAQLIALRQTVEAARQTNPDG